MMMLDNGLVILDTEMKLVEKMKKRREGVESHSSTTTCGCVKRRGKGESDRMTQQLFVSPGGEYVTLCSVNGMTNADTTSDALSDQLKVESANVLSGCWFHSENQLCSHDNFEALDQLLDYFFFH